MALAPVDQAAARRFRARAARRARSDGAAPAITGEIAARLDERLDLMKIQPLRVLDAGSGTGAAMAVLRARYPAAEIMAFDDVPAELPVLRARSHASGAFTRFKALLGLGASPVFAGVADLAQLPLAPNSINLAWSNLALPRVADPLPMMREVQRVLAPGGLFIFSSLGPDTLRELREAFAAADSGSAHVHDFIDMHDLGDMLVESGFTAPVMEMETLKLTYTDVAGLVGDLRAMGGANALAARRRGLTGKGIWQRLRAALAPLRGAGGADRLPASFEIVYGHAWKPEPRRPAGETPQVVKFYPAWERKP